MEATERKAIMRQVSKRHPPPTYHKRLLQLQDQTLRRVHYVRQLVAGVPVSPMCCDTSYMGVGRTRYVSGLRYDRHDVAAPREADECRIVDSSTNRIR